MQIHVGWHGGAQPSSGGYTHSGASANFYERPPREGRGGNRGKQGDSSTAKFENFKEPDPGSLFTLKLLVK